MKKLLLLGLLMTTALLAAENREVHLENVRRLTDGGENAEAYFSPDGKQLIFQSTRPPYSCDQIFTMNSDGSSVRLISSGKGRTTCAYFIPGTNRVLYSSTHEASSDCPPAADRSRGYVWPLYASYDLYTADADGANVKRLTNSPGYDAEATVSPDGRKIVFTSDRDGDLELYTMNMDGSGIRRITSTPGYDGGAFFSPDSKSIVFRARHTADTKELEDYRSLLKQNLVRPNKLEIYIVDADGGNSRQVTNNGAANFCPFFHPDGKRIVFASNQHDPSGRNFDLYLINADGTGQKRITYDPSFDGFPMFTADGKKLVFASNRQSGKPGETNIFIADWIDQPPVAKNGSLQKHVEFLASDELQGRLSGTEGARRAALYIASQFQSDGLTPPPGQKDFSQEFSFTSGVRLGKGNMLSARLDGKNKDYELGNDFTPTGFSENAVLSAIPVVLAGYGIRAPNLSHDDYGSVDVKGKAVVVYRFGPEGNDPKSEFSEYYPLRYKAMVAREQGAAALIVVSPDEKNDELLRVRTDTSTATSGIPVFSIRRSLLHEWFSAAGKTLPDTSNPHANNLRTDLPDVQVTLRSNLIFEKARTTNVLGWLPATAQTSETIVVGAHYDHLGLGVEGSLAEKPGEVHNGADDNASGVASLLELAQLQAKSTNRNYNLLFIAFGGEEMGVLGSSYFVKTPILPLRNIVAMINMDMVGRLREKKLAVGGVGTSPVWKNLLTETNKEQFTLKFQEDGYGPSDHSVFYGKDIPVLFFFTGPHSDYHKPGDDAEKIEYEGLALIVSYIDRIVDGLQQLAQRPQFTKVKSSSPQMAGRGFRVYLGTIPDYTEEVKGVKLSGVRSDSPAEKAGMKAGDTIVKFGNKNIENIYDYTYALQEHNPGEVVTVVVLRDGKELPLRVELDKRSGGPATE